MGEGIEDWKRPENMSFLGLLIGQQKDSECTSFFEINAMEKYKKMREKNALLNCFNIEINRTK